MSKTAFKKIVNNLRSLNAEALANYHNVPLRNKIRFLVDFLNEDDQPDFRLLCVSLLRSLLMKDFESAWNTMTNRQRKLQLLERMKLLLIDNSNSLAIKQAAVHIAVLIFKSQRLETHVHLCFQDFIMGLISMDTDNRQENVLLLFFLIVPLMRNEFQVWKLFVNECINVAKRENWSMIPNQMALECIIFAFTCEIDLFAAGPYFEWVLRPLISIFIEQEQFPNQYEWIFQNDNNYNSVVYQMLEWLNHAQLHNTQLQVMYY